MKKIETCKCELVKQDKTLQQPVSKIGGMPAFYNKVEWPKCSYCGRKMDFIGQISLSEPLKISTKYDMAYIFMCPGEFDEEGCLKCETWDHQSGANVVIFQRKTDVFFREEHEQYIPEYILFSEMTKEPLIDFSDFSIDEKVRDMVVMSTKIGGVPAWLQNDETPFCSICGKQMKFIAQISSELNGPLDEDPSKWAEQNKKFLDFGGDGMGYVFICEDESDHIQGAFLWQCS
jgi:hypothetical protein